MSNLCPKLAICACLVLPLSAQSTNAGAQDPSTQKPAGLELTLERPPEVVVAPGAHPAWDAHTIYGPTVIEQGGLYHMLYAGNRVQDRQDYTKHMGLGYATSKDGLTWEKVGDGPSLIHPAAKRATTGAYFYDGERWAVLYTVPGKDFYAKSGVYLATSDAPGGPWSGKAEPVITPPSGSWCEFVMPLNIIRSGDEVRLYFYGSNRKDDLSGFGMATSKDLIDWEFYNDPKTMDPHYADADPFLVPGQEGEWDAVAVTSASILHGADGWEMFYVGYDRPISQRSATDTPLWLGHATSKDGVKWSKDAGNPVLQTAQKIWPLTCVLRQDDRYLFYQDTSGGRAGISMFSARISSKD